MCKAWQACLFVTSQKFSRYCIVLQCYGDCILGCWGNCTDWLSWAWQQHHHRNLVHWSDRKTSDGIEREETRKVMSWSRNAVSPGQRTCSRVISSTGCYPKCRTELLHHPSYLPEMAPIDFYLFPKLKDFMKKMQIHWWWRRYLLEHEQDQQFFCNRIQALEKCGTKYISVAEDCVEKWQDMRYISCD